MKYQFVSLATLAVFSGVASAIKYGNVRIEQLTPQFRNKNNPKSTRVLLKYGPYYVPAYDESSEEDVIFETNWKANATKPCSNCVLKYVSAEIVNKDGVPSKLETGAYLTKFTMSVEGAGKRDAACPRFSNGQRILVANTERKDILFGKAQGNSVGYYLGLEDKMSMDLELQNDVNAAMDMYLQLTFEYTPGKPADYAPARNIRFPCES